MASPAVKPEAPAPNPAPQPPLQAWTCPRGPKLAFVARAPGSRIAGRCQSCRQWYEKEQAA